MRERQVRCLAKLPAHPRTRTVLTSRTTTPSSLLLRAVIISNPTVSKAEAAAKKYKLDAFSSEAMDVIQHPDVEAVWICSPSSFHAERAWPSNSEA